MYRLLIAGAILSTYFLFAVRANGQTTGHLSNSERSPIAAALVEDLYSKANQLRIEGKNEEALTIINKAIWFDGDCGRCFSLRSGIEANLRMFAEGVADGDSGMKLSQTPRDRAMGAYNKGFGLNGLHRNSESLDAYNRSIEFDPTYAAGYFGKGKALYFDGSWAQSKAALEEAVKLNPKYGVAWAYLAEDQIFLGDGPGGLASANSAVAFAPSDVRSFRARTIAHMSEGNYEAMLADATRALELDPSRPQGHLLRGHALNLLGRYTESAQEYALEPDRNGAGSEPSSRGLDTRIYNCGDFSTEIQTPQNYNNSIFSDCAKRIGDQWNEIIHLLETLPTPKHAVPGLLPKKVNNN